MEIRIDVKLHINTHEGSAFIIICVHRYSSLNSDVTSRCFFRPKKSGFVASVNGGFAFTKNRYLRSMFSSSTAGDVLRKRDYGALILVGLRRASDDLHRHPLGTDPETLVGGFVALTQVDRAS